MRLRTSWIGVVALLAAPGCATLGKSGDGDFSDAEQSRELTLHVMNDNFYDATIYAVWGSYRRRLGVVTGQREDTFRFRWAPQELSIEIRLLAVGSTTTYSLPVDQGDILELRVQPDLHRRIPPAVDAN